MATAFRAALAEEPGLFGPVADQPSTVEALRRVHRELRDLDDLQRHRLAQSDARAAAVVAIDERVTQRLEGRWHDETDLMVTAAALVHSGDAAVDVGPLVVHLPQQISSSAARLLRAVAAQAPVTVIAGLTGRAGASTQRLLERLDLAAAPPAAPPSPPPPGRADEPEVELVVAADEDDEVRTALRRVVEAAEAGIALERIAIVHAPRAPYGRLLTEHLTAARLPWNGITSSSVAERVAGRTLLGLLELDAAALRQRDVFALLASVPPSRRRPVAAWEQQARRARVVGGRRQWEERLAARAADLRRQADAGGEEQAWRHEEATRADELRAFVAALAERLEPPSQPTWAAHAGWAGRLLELVIGGPAEQVQWSPEEQRAAERVERVLDRLARLDGVADDVEGHGVDRAVFRAALDAELADGPATVGRLGEGIFVGPIPLAVGIDADLVLVLGLVEGGLPGGLGDDPLLSDRTRRALDGALTTAAERRDRLHHQLLAVAGAARLTVVASRPLADLRTGSARYASRWLVGLERVRPGPRRPPHLVPPGPAGRPASRQRAGGRPGRPATDAVERARARGAPAGWNGPGPPQGLDPDGRPGQRPAHDLRREPGLARCGRRRPLAAAADRADRARGVGPLPVQLLRPARPRCPRGRRTAGGAVPPAGRDRRPRARGAGVRGGRADPLRGPARAGPALVDVGARPPGGRPRRLLRGDRGGG